MIKDASLRELIDKLNLTETTDMHYEGQNLHPRWPRIFGGQVLAQALMAASRTVDTRREAHSLHANFLRPGKPSIPVSYAVENSRDGGSFSSRQVVASQQGKPILVCSLSFQTPEVGDDHQPPIPNVPAPEQLVSERQLFLDAGLDEADTFVTAGTSFDFRAVEPIDYVNPVRREGFFHVWVKAVEPLPDEVAIHQALLAYVSDCYLIDAALIPHAYDYSDPNLVCATLDHSIWFHDEVRIDDWLLHEVQVQRTGRNRGLTLGKFFSRQGSLLATVTQECLMRMKTPT